MARGVNENERREAVTLVAAGDIPPPDDIDAAFDEWREGFASGEEPGKLRAYQIPLDERGNPIATAKNQVRLGSWPIDLYGFDELCTMLIRDFMPPEKILAVRLLGIKPGTAGVQFNKIVVLRAPKFSSESGGPSPSGDTLTSLMKAISEANDRTLQLVRSMTPAAAPDTSFERIMQMSQAMNQPMMAMLTALLPALAGRPVGGGGLDINGLSGLLDVAGKIADMRGGGGEGGLTGNDWVDTLRAVVPILKPAVEAIPSILAAQPARPAIAGPRPAPVQPPRPAAPRPPPPGATPTQPPPAAVGATPGPASNMGDIPSGDAQMFAELKPQIDSLVQMAEQGSDAPGAADLLFDNVIIGLPDELYEKLADLIGGPNFVTQAAVFNPKVNAHADWFRQFQTRIIGRYDDEEKAAATAPTAAN